MKLTELLQDRRMQNGLAVFGSLYAKRMLEGRYDELMNTAVGQKLKKLSRPTKLGIEVALNFLGACVSTREATLTNQPWKQLIFEVLQDAPAEFSKRLLNGKEPTHVPVAEEVQITLESIGQLDEESQDKLLRWLQHAGEKERQEMAEHLSKKVSVQAIGAGTANSSTSDTAPSQTRPKSPSILSDLAGGISRLNDRLERRHDREGGTE